MQRTKPLANTATEETGSVSSPMLQVEKLTVDVDARGATVRLVDEFDLVVGAQERVALVGESGSGKSVLARSIMRLDRKVKLSGSVELNGVQLLGLSEKEMRRVRGSRVGMVFQDPMTALNPLQSIGRQVTEPLRLQGVSRKEAWHRAVELLDELAVPRASQCMQAYPHEFSGGMRQRVVLAMALIGGPDFLIADEPTTALDVRVQQQVIQVLEDVSRQRKLSVLLITHDLALVAGFADRVAVMYAGRKVEDRSIIPLFERAAHPYTQALLRVAPRIDIPQDRLVPMPGNPPSPDARPSGCSFHPRCPARMKVCETTLPVAESLPEGGTAACHLLNTTLRGAG